MAADALTLSSDSVRYVKNGTGGQWWKTALANSQVHAGWSNIPAELLLKPDFAVIKRIIEEKFEGRPGSSQDFNALRNLLDRPSQHLWITFEDDCMWWCTVRDLVEVNPEGRSESNGHFWLICQRPWFNRSIAGKPLATTDLPGIVTTVAGLRGTVCAPSASRAILRVIRDEKDLMSKRPQLLGVTTNGRFKIW